MFIDLNCFLRWAMWPMGLLFSWSYALFELRNLAKMKDTTDFLVSATPLKSLNRIGWNFVVMKDIMCTYAFLREMLIWYFLGAIYIAFFVRLPVTNAWNCHSLYTAFSSNVGAWGMWACSLFLSLSKQGYNLLQYFP